MNFNGKCLINNITSTPKKVRPQLRNLNTNFALDNCLFVSVKITKNAKLAEESISQELRMKSIDEARNYLTEKIIQNELMSKKHRKVCTTLNYI